MPSQRKMYNVWYVKIKNMHVTHSPRRRTRLARDQVVQGEPASSK